MTLHRHNLLKRARADERGFTLIEVMVGSVIMAIAFVGLMSMMFTLLATSMAHRQSVRGGLVSTEIAEILEGAPYVNCATAAGYSTSLTTGLSYVATIDSVTYLADRTSPTPTFVTSCPATDQGIQTIKVKVVIDTAFSGGGTVTRTEFVEYTKRNRACPTSYATVPGDAC